MRVADHAGSARALHDRPPPSGAAPEAWFLHPAAPALVLGSTQRDAAVDETVAASAGIEVVRRGSGGGAVLLWPRGVVWVDVWVPAGDRRWDERVDVASHWVGALWAGVLETLGCEAVEVHHGGLATGPLGPAVCFDGVGPGEVLVGGGKAVGVSQRRTREWARFQTTAYTADGRPPDLDVVAALVAPLAASAGLAPEAMARALVPVPLPVRPDDLAGTLRRALRAA